MFGDLNIFFCAGILFTKDFTIFWPFHEHPLKPESYFTAFT